jgi:hypothetical protein
MFGLKQGKLAMVQCVGSADIVSKHTTIHTTGYLVAIYILCGQPSCFADRGHVMRPRSIYVNTRYVLRPRLCFADHAQVLRPRSSFEAAVRL